MSGKKTSRFTKVSFSLYRRMLILYPAAFRERFEVELLQAYQETFNQNIPGGTFLAMVRCSTWLFTDLFFAAVHERHQQWRDTMKSRWLIARGLGVFFLAAWFAFVGLSFGKNLFHWPVKDPMVWLLGEQFSNLAFNALNFGILFGPFLVLLLFLSPSLRIKQGTAGDDILQIRVQRMTKLNLLVISICGVVTVLFWSVIILSRFGWV